MTLYITLIDESTPKATITLALIMICTRTFVMVKKGLRDCFIKQC